LPCEAKGSKTSIFSISLVSQYLRGPLKEEENGFGYPSKGRGPPDRGRRDHHLQLGGGKKASFNRIRQEGEFKKAKKRRGEFVVQREKRRAWFIGTLDLPLEPLPNAVPVPRSQQLKIGGE
jgi:hypothetical protein